MEASHILGFVASATTIVYSCCGLPAQIVKNHKSRSTGGLSLFMMTFVFLTLFTWMIYAVVKEPKDWFIFVSNMPGAVFSLLILGQFLLYKAKNTEEKR